MAYDESATTNPFSGLGSFFFANDKSLPQSTRQKIALAMMMQKRAYPKTFGEGLSAIGDSLGDIGTMRRMEREAAATDAAGRAKEAEIIGGGSSPRSFAPSEIAPIQQSALPPPDLPSALPPAAPAVPLPPDQQQSYAPGAPFRMPSESAVQDWRNQNPAPVLPRPVAPPPAPMAAPPSFNDRFDASFPHGQQSSLAPNTPVMAFGGDPSEDVPAGRDMVATALANQRGGPPPNPTIPAAPGGMPVNAFTQDQGIRPAPVTPQAKPGYVLEPGPKPIAPPTQTPLMERIQKALSDAAPGDREALEARLKPYYDNEKSKLGQVHEAYKDELIQHRALTMKMHEQRAAQRASEDAAQAAELSAIKERQAIEEGKIPKVKQDVETGLTYNPQTKEWEAPRIAGTGPDTKPAFKGSEFQGKALVNYGRARLAHEGLNTTPTGGTETAEQTLADSPLQSVMSTIGVGRSMGNPAYREAETHAENFVQAFIRQQSGGAYGKEELETEARSMLPKYGDTPKQIEAKREQREQFLSGMYSIIGPSGQKGVTIDANKREAGRELEGREAVFPDKTIRVRRNGQWVPK